ncbi:MAG: MarR family transcriptional regulator [Candidatus Krumholzibacteria bacterium]|nr:MarR family transcriptional regulator [Candidatus Krumholzibacteria bacterium]
MTGFGIGPSEAHTLSYLESYGPCPIGELVRVFGYKKPTMTSMLDRLERRGLVTRELNASDRRSFLIEITPAGVALAQTARVLVEKTGPRNLKKSIDR